MGYFVTKRGIEVARYSNQKLAVKRALEEFDKQPHLGMIAYGIGKFKRKKGKLMYNHLPLHFYI